MYIVARIIAQSFLSIVGELIKSARSQVGGETMCGKKFQVK